MKVALFGLKHYPPRPCFVCLTNVKVGLSFIIQRRGEVRESVYLGRGRKNPVQVCVLLCLKCCILPAVHDPAYTVCRKSKKRLRLLVVGNVFFSGPQGL